jgi:hypothetical protein
MMKPLFQSLRLRPNGGAIPTLARWWPGRRAARDPEKSALRVNWISGAAARIIAAGGLLPGFHALLLDMTFALSLPALEARLSPSPALARIARKELFL